MKHLRHYFRRDIEPSAKGRSWTSKPFAGTLAATAGLAFAVAVDYWWFDAKPNVESLRFPVIFLGYLLLIDVYRLIKQKQPAASTLKTRQKTRVD
jgi:hypothetical protein